MAMVLDHTIVPAHNKVASARFFARIFGLEYNDMHHYAFKVGDAEFVQFSGVSRRRGPPTAAVRARAPTRRSTIGAAAAASISRTRAGAFSKF